MKKLENLRIRNFTFTTFLVRKVDFWEKLFLESEDIKFFIGQEEKTKNGKKHIQGYCQLNKRLRMKSIKILLKDNSAHIEYAHGSAEDNIKYCSKEDTRIQTGIQFRLGEPKHPGKPTIYNDVMRAIKNGANREELMEEHQEACCRSNTK